MTISQELTAEITKPREETSPGGAVERYLCVGVHVAGEKHVWLRWQKWVGQTRCGAHLELAVVQEDGSVAYEVESHGFSRDDCPYDWLAKSAEIDKQWRREVLTYWEEKAADEYREREENAA